MHGVGVGAVQLTVYVPIVVPPLRRLNVAGSHVPSVCWSVIVFHVIALPARSVRLHVSATLPVEIAGVLPASGKPPPSPQAASPTLAMTNTRNRICRILARLLAGLERPSAASLAAAQF